MKALVSTIEPRETGYRVAQVVEDGKTFPMSDVFVWMDCPDYVTQDYCWYDPADGQYKWNPFYGKQPDPWPPIQDPPEEPVDQ